MEREGKRSGKTLKVEHKGSRVLQQRSACGVTLTPGAQNALRPQPGAQRLSGGGDRPWAEQRACAGGLSPLRVSVRGASAQRQRKDKLHLCMKFFSRAAGVLCREWMLRFTRSSSVEVDALSSFKRLQRIKPKKRIRTSFQTPPCFWQDPPSPTDPTQKTADYWLCSKHQTPLGLARARLDASLRVSAQKYISSNSPVSSVCQI